MRSRWLLLLTAGLLAGCSPTARTSPWTSGAAIPSPTTAPTSATTAGPSAAQADLKLMDFNIEYGGVQVDFAKIVEAVKAADPDVVAIEEAEGNTQRLADELGWPYANVRTQTISKFPIIDPPGANGRYVLIELSPGSVVAISNVHLPSDPYGPYDVRDGKTAEAVIALEQATRLPAIQERLDVLPALVATGIPTFLTGDFNAPSHLDWTAATVGLRSHIKYALDWPVSKAIEAAGFIDTYRVLHPDPTKDAGLTWWAGRPLVDGYPDHNDPQDRIDIIYAAGAAIPMDIKIIGEVGGPQVDIGVDPWGTDHRAVMTTFSLTPGVAQPYVAVDQRLVAKGDPILVRYHGPAASVRLVPVGGGTADVGLTQQITDVDGTWSVPTAALAPGDYEVQLLDGERVASQTPLSIAAPEAKVALTIERATYQAGDPISVSWRDAPGARWDWIGIYPRGGDPLVDDYVFYVYTGQAVAGSVVIDANGEGEWPIPAGDYDAHYLSDDGYLSLAVAPFSVAP
jgi:endonuclease/exonuclease/phosphatase family metal-dependent hydrolase